MNNTGIINQLEVATNGSQTVTEDAIMDIVDETFHSSSSTPLHSIQSTRSIEMYQAALGGDWNGAKTIIDKKNDIVRKYINSGLDTALHVAVAAKQKEFVKYLLVEMDREDLVLQNIDHNTALHIAAAMGVVDIAKMLVNKNQRLPNLPGRQEVTPIHVAALFGHKEMVRYLYKTTTFTEIRGMKLINLFHAIIAADIYDVALWMLEEKKELLSLPRDGNKETALHLMARKPSTTISRKKHLNFFKKLAHYLSMGIFFREAKMQTLAHQLVEKLWKSVVVAENVSHLLGPPSTLLFDAAESGNVEFLVILIRSYPDIIWKANEKSQSLFHIAAFNRHESIFKIINELRGIKNLVASYIETGSEDNLLHMVARLPPPRRLNVVSGAALQMQREIIWFEAVEKLVPRSYIKTKNKKGTTAHDLFTAQHDNLRKDGEKWMKETATACMLVATLIATVVFGAVFAMPGSYDDSTGYDAETKHNNIAGYPRFRKKVWFDVFMISDSISLFSSVIAVVFFLSLLTSRYAEKDFRRALPTKLMLGLLALFFSIVSMVVAFIATMILFRDHEPHWTFILIITLASGTAFSFTYLNFHLWFDTIYSAYTSKFLFYGCKRSLFQREENCLTSLFF